MGWWRMQALPRIKPEVLQGLVLQLPPELNLSSLQTPSNKDDEFIVGRDEFGVTIIHPASDTWIRVVEEEHRYKPEEWTYETQKYPKVTPSISYQLIAPEEGKPGEILIAVGPGAFVEVQEPAPFEYAKEWELPNWQPRLRGNFVVTIVEMPENFLVPLPNEDIDVATLLNAGGKMHYPDKHIWRGAISYEDYVLTWGMLIGQIAFFVIPAAFELALATVLARAAAVASEAGAVAPRAAALAAETLAPRGAALASEAAPEAAALGAEALVPRAAALASEAAPEAAALGAEALAPRAASLAAEAAPEAAALGAEALAPRTAALASGPPRHLLAKAAILARLRVGEPFVKGVAGHNIHVASSLPGTSELVSASTPTSISPSTPVLQTQQAIQSALPSAPVRTELAQSLIRIEGAGSTALASPSAQAGIAGQASMGFPGPPLVAGGVTSFAETDLPAASQAPAAPKETQLLQGPPAAFAPGKAPRTPAEVIKFLRDAGLRKQEIIRFGGEDAKQLGPRIAARVARLAEHFTAADLKALGNFLSEYDVIIDDEMVDMLIDRIEAGRMGERLRTIQVRAEIALMTGTEFDLLNEMSVLEPRARSPKSPWKTLDPAWKMAEEHAGPAIEKQFRTPEPSPRVPAPLAGPGETLGSTVPEWVIRDDQGEIEDAFEVKRFRLDEMGIGLEGQKIGPRSKATVEALDRARSQLGGRRANLPAGSRQHIIFNITGQGVTDVVAVGKAIKAALLERLVVYDHVWVQVGYELTEIN